MSIKIKNVVAPSNAPYLPPNVTQEIVWSLKGLMGGEADAGQQAMALKWIILELCETNGLPYRPDSARDTDFALGKMHVGRELVRMINMTPEQITNLPRLGGNLPGEDDAPQNM